MTERFTTPLPRKTATPRLRATFEQMNTDIGLVLFPALAHHEDIYTATWALVRESLVAAPNASRTDKEIVAAAVSVANRCPYCVAAHTTFLHATADHELAETIWRDEIPANPHHAALIDWAKATRDPRRCPPIPSPPSQAPDLIGTAVAFHFVNRMVSALIEEDLLPAKLQKSRLVRRMAGSTLAKTTRYTPTPGDSLHLITTTDQIPPRWSSGTSIGTAYAALHAIAATGGELISPTARNLVETTATAMAAQHPPLGSSWLTEPINELDPGDRPGATIALLSAVAGYRITSGQVAAWRADHPSDSELVKLVAYGTMVSVDHIARQLSIPDTSDNPR